MRFKYLTIGYCVLALSLVLCQVVLAVGGDYLKTNSSGANPNLYASDWNNLVNDFLDKDGDSMSGPLDMAGNTVVNLPHPPSSPGDMPNKLYVDNAAAAIGSAYDRNGNPINTVCDSTDGSGWHNYPPTGTPIGVYIDVDTTDGGIPNFTAPPVYILSLSTSAASTPALDGSSALYWPEIDSFRVYIAAPGADEVYAQTNNWRINWCGYGN